MKLKYFAVILIVLIKCLNAAVIQNQKLDFLELKPNGSLILRGTMENSSDTLQQSIIYTTILNAIRWQIPLQSSHNALSEMNVKIYGDGIEHKFPPFLERVIQRIQTYFSIYKYTDTSQPLREQDKPPIVALLNETLTLANEIDVNLTSDNNLNANHNKTSKVIKRHTTTAPVLTLDEDEDIEFIEIKKFN